MINRSVAITALFAALLVTPAFAASIELSFDRLPSEQGWTYEGDLPETTFFSLQNGILRMDGRGQGGNQIARYVMYDVIDPALPFTLRFNLRVDDSDNLDLFEVFAVGALGPDFGPRISWHRVRGAGSSRAAVDVELEPGIPTPVGTDVDTEFHDYLLTAQAGGTLNVFIDGSLIAQGNTPTIGFVNVLFFGDSAFADANALVELRQFSFDQSNIPEPGTFAFMTIGVLVATGHGWRRHRTRAESRQLKPPVRKARTAQNGMQVARVAQGTERVPQFLRAICRLGRLNNCCRHAPWRIASRLWKRDDCCGPLNENAVKVQRSAGEAGVPLTSSMSLRSHGNGCGSLQPISSYCWCVGLSNTLYSTEIMTDGIRVASSFPL